MVLMSLLLAFSSNLVYNYVLLELFDFLYCCSFQCLVLILLFWHQVYHGKRNPYLPLDVQSIAFSYALLQRFTDLVNFIVRKSLTES